MTVVQIARVAQLWFYPVKSMAGIPLESAYVGLDGLLADRRYAFVQAQKAATSGFPWMTARESSRMLAYRTQVAQLPLPDADDPAVQVRSPGGVVREVADPELCAELSALHGRPLLLLKNSRGNFDAQHVSLFSLATARTLAAASGAAIDCRQFRANIYLEPISGEPFVEEEWAGRILQIGDEARIAITKRDGRCMIVNLDPETGEQDARVLREISQQHQGKAGVYGNVMRRGVVRVGDAIREIECRD